MGGRKGAPARPPPDVVLASGSPRRRMIFRAMGLRFAVVSSGIEEDGWTGEDPARLAARMAAAKGRAVVEELRLRSAPPWVVGADTVVATERSVFGQPRDGDEARRMIRALAGRSHRVLTAVSIWSGPVEIVSFVESTVVRFRGLGAGDVERYVEEGDWRGKAGAYAIQGAAGAFIEAVEGDAWNVVGFPVHGFLDRARAAGIPVPDERDVRPGLARLWSNADVADDLDDRRWGPRWA